MNKAYTIFIKKIAQTKLSEQYYQYINNLNIYDSLSPTRSDRKRVKPALPSFQEARATVIIFVVMVVMTMMRLEIHV
jgi:hypothetical protein